MNEQNLGVSWGESVVYRNMISRCIKLLAFRFHEISDIEKKSHEH